MVDQVDDSVPSLPPVHDSETDAISKKYNLDDYDNEDGMGRCGGLLFGILTFWFR